MNAVFALFVVLGFIGWFGLIGHVGVPELVYGALVILSAWAIFKRLSELPLSVAPSHASTWFVGVASYLFFYVGVEVIRSTFRVFFKVLAPQLNIQPAILAVSVPGASKSALILLAYGISLTPGQQVVAIDDRRCILYVHFLDAPHPEAVREEIRSLFHRYLKEATS